MADSNWVFKCVILQGQDLWVVTRWQVGVKKDAEEISDCVVLWISMLVGCVLLHRM